MKIKNLLDYKLFLLWNLFYLFHFIFSITKNLYARNYLELFNPKIGFFDTLKLWLLEYAYLNFALIFIAILIRKFLLRNFSWSIIITLSVILSIIIYFPFYIFIHLFEKILFQEINFVTQLNAWETLIINFPQAFIFISSFLLIILSYYYVQELRIQERAKLKINDQLIEAKLQVLNFQLKPHFLFNSINNIVGLIDSKPHQAKKALYNLSEFFRSVLRTGIKTKISLAEELKITESYVKILKIRFGDKIKINNKIEIRLLKSEIPAIVFQPFIENAVKHGMKPSECLTITLKAYAHNSYVNLEIVNDGKSLNSRNIESGYGFQITKQKLENLYGMDYRLKIENIVLDGLEVVQVKIKFPIEK